LGRFLLHLKIQQEVIADSIQSTLNAVFALLQTEG